MARSTQYIGLTKKAEQLLKGATILENDDNYTEGMFDEIVPLGTWRDENGRILYEILQASPWSSGPMLFTCLAYYQGEKLVKIKESMWKEEPCTMQGGWYEFNKELGLFWV